MFHCLCAWGHRHTQGATREKPSQMRYRNVLYKSRSDFTLHLVLTQCGLLVLCVPMIPPKTCPAPLPPLSSDPQELLRELGIQGRQITIPPPQKSEQTTRWQSSAGAGASPAPLPPFLRPFPRIKRLPGMVTRRVSPQLRFRPPGVGDEPLGPARGDGEPGTGSSSERAPLSSIACINYPRNHTICTNCTILITIEC